VRAGRIFVVIDPGPSASSGVEKPMNRLLRFTSLLGLWPVEWDVAHAR
jgi:hypothetical protein